jgi:hypothetical protein
MYEIKVYNSDTHYTLYNVSDYQGIIDLLKDINVKNAKKIVIINNKKI